MKKLLLSALLALSASAFAAGTPAGTQITNVAYLDTLPSPTATTPTETPSPPVTITVVHVPGVTVDPNSPGTPTSPVVPTNPLDPTQCGQTVMGVPGQNAVLTYNVNNPSNGADTYALTTNAIAGTNGAQVQYYLDNGDSIFDPATDTAVTSLNLNADQTVRVYATYPVPANATSSTGFSFTPVATSQADGSVLDMNNYGCVTTQKTYAVTITPDHTGNVESPGTISYSHTITNTGNTPLDSTTLIPGQTNDQPTWPTTVQLGNNPAYPTLAEALQNYGPIAPGQSVPVTVTITVPAGVAGGITNTDVFSVHTTVPAGDTTSVNGTPTDVTATDVTTILAGQSSINKTVMSCGADASCANPMAVPNNEVKPGEFVQYTVAASNTGQGGLHGVRVRDPLPDNLTGVSYSASLTGVAAGQLLYSVDGTNWTTTVPSIVGTSNTTVYAAFDGNSDGVLDYNDVLPASAGITLKITAKVN